MGWYTNAEGTGQAISVISGDVVYERSVTLYAKWKKKNFTPIIKTSLINAELLTENGSYIDSEGNVYLMAEDIEAYLNGTLTFYRKEDGLNII